MSPLDQQCRLPRSAVDRIGDPAVTARARLCGRRPDVHELDLVDVVRRQLGRRTTYAVRAHAHAVLQRNA